MNIFDNIAANLSLKYENSEFYKNKLIKRYKPLITPGVKSQDELIISLEKHFDLELTDKAVMSKTFLELCVMGNIDCDEPDMIDFEIYRVVRNSKSEALYACEKYDLDDDDIFISLRSITTSLSVTRRLSRCCLSSKRVFLPRTMRMKLPNFSTTSVSAATSARQTFSSSTRLLHMTSSI